MKNKPNTIYKQLILGLLSFWVLSACASEIIITDPNTGEKFTIPAQYSDVPGIKMLGEYCAAEGGQKIKEVVQVDGYYSDSEGCYSCWLNLVDTSYQYIEFKNRHVKPKAGYMIKEPGIWKVYKSTKDDPNCHPEINRNLSSRIAEPYNSFAKQNCIATKKQTKIESRYGSYSEKLGVTRIPDTNADLNMYYEYIKDLHSDELIAQWKSFLLFPRHLKLNPSATYQCETIKINSAKQPLTEAVIKAKDSK